MRPWLARTQQAATTFWAMRDARERRMLMIAAAVILGALYYLLLVAPAITGRERLDKNLPLLREQVTQMQAMAGEAAGLSNNNGATVATMSNEMLAAALSAHGLKAQSLNVTDEVAQMRLTNVSYSLSISCLDELRRSAHIVVSAAKITTLAQPDQVDATFTLLQARKP